MKVEPTITPEDALAISAISAEFGYLVDHGRATECEALFLEEAKLSFGPGSPKPGTLAGVAAIRAFLVARQSQTHLTTRHQATNFRLQMQQDGRVNVQSLLTVFRSDDHTRQPLVAIVADVEELFAHNAQGEWRIEERLTTPIFTK